MEEKSDLYNRDYILLNSSNFLYSLYATIFIFMPPFLDHIGVRPSEIGFIMATGTLISVSLKPIGGWIADRANKPVFIAMGAFIAAFSTIPWFFVRSPTPILYLYRVFQGVGYSLFATFAYAYIASHAPRMRRAEALGVFGLSFFIPTAVGGGIGEAVIKAFDFNTYFLIGAVIAFLSGLPSFFIKDRAKEAGLAPKKFKEVMGKQIFLFVFISLIFGTTFGGIFTFLPVMIFKQSGDGIFLFLLFYSISVILTRTIWRKVTDVMNRRISSIISLSLLASGTLLLTFSGDPVLLVTAAIITGLGHGFLFPSLSALVVDHAGMENSGVGMALFTGAFDLGLVLGSGGLGIILELYGFAVMFLICGTLPLIGVLLLARRKNATSLS